MQNEAVGRSENVLMGSDARQGTAALVPNRLFTLTIIMASAAGAVIVDAAFFSFFGFSEGFPSVFALCSAVSRVGDLARFFSWSR